MTAIWSKFSSGLLLALVAGVLPGDMASGQGPPREEVFRLRTVSVFDLSERSFLRGQASQCGDTPSLDVTQYPAFKSAKPIFGVVRFGQSNSEDTGTAYHFAADESQGTGKGYDRLYFDLNTDLDLRDDPVLKPQQHPPAEASLRDSSVKQQVLFDFLKVQFDHGPSGLRPVELLPRLTVSVYTGMEGEYKMVAFVRTDVRKGDIRIGGEQYGALLGNDYAILGRLDAPNSALQLTPKAGRQFGMEWWGGDRLMGMHKVGGRHYVLSANPAGDELRVRPYDGEFGTFMLGAGGRELSLGGVQGSLQSRDLAVAVGNADANGFLSETASCSLPIGEYLPSYLSVHLGKFRIAISQNYHSDGKPRDRSGRPLVYGIGLKKDRPFVLDFGGRPEVLFASPAQDQRVKLGGELVVKAVLIDPKLDIMIRRLDDTTRKQPRAEGMTAGYQRDLSLDPTVIVTRTNGEKVAEGVMPFG